MTIFEKIINREIPAHIIWEDDHHIAFLDIKPINPGHLLVVPKKPIADILDMDESSYTTLWLAAKKLAASLRQACGSKRIGYIVEGFGVDHVHIHLIPINGPHELEPSKAQDASNEELETIANEIRKVVEENL